MAKTKKVKAKSENKLMKGINVANPSNLGEKMANKLISIFE